MAADEPRKRRVSLRGRSDGSRDGPCASRLTMDGPFALSPSPSSLSLSLSLRHCVYGPFQTCGSEPTEGLINFSNRTKITRFAFAKYRFPSLPFVLSSRREVRRGKGRKFSTLPLYSWEKFGRIDGRRRAPISFRKKFVSTVYPTWNFIVNAIKRRRDEG